ncbi:hypothetical protein JCM10212_002063 [Sporobolomyces blumeae]
MPRSTRALKPEVSYVTDDDAFDVFGGEGQEQAGRGGGAGGPSDQDAAAAGGDDEYTPAVKTKRTKTTTSSKAGKGGRKKLEVFQSMPIDVLVEILGHLDLKTLLAASRTCSLFRRLTHAPSGKRAWDNARRSVGLHDLERGDVAHWEVAQVLYDKTCVGCGKGRAGIVDYYLMVRGCADCMRTNSKTRSKMPKTAVDELAFDCAPFAPYPEFEFGENGTKYWWKPTLLRLSKQIRALETDDDVASFVLSRAGVQKAAFADAKLMKAWEPVSKVNADLELETKRQLRWQKIKEKLVSEEGFTAEEVNTFDLQFHPDVNNARPFSDNVWTRIRPALVEIASSTRDKMAAQDKLAKLKDRALAMKPFWTHLEAQLPPEADDRILYPPFANFLSLPSVEALYTPDEAVVTAKAFADAKPAIDAEVQQFAVEIQEAVRDNVSNVCLALDPEFDTPIDDVLKTAPAALKCPSSTCGRYLTFPSILDHVRVCCGDTVAITAKDLETTPGRMMAIAYIAERANAATAGSDKLPLSCTTTDLHALGPHFECGACEDDRKSLSIIGLAAWAPAYQSSGLTWEELLDHGLSKHPDEFCVTYRPPPPPPPADPATLAKDDEGEAEDV